MSEASNEVMGESLEEDKGVQEIVPKTPAEEVNVFDKLVGEDKQYRSPQALAESKLAADARIEELRIEVESLKGVAEKTKTTEELLEVIKQSAGSTQKREETEGITPETLDAWYEKKRQEELKEKEAEQEVEKIKGNQKKAWELLSAEGAFGSLENAKRVIAQYIDGDTAKADIINKLSGYSPEDLLDFVKAKSKDTKVTFSTDESTISSGVGEFEKLGGLTWEKVKAAEKANPKLRKDLAWTRYVSQNLTTI